MSDHAHVAAKADDDDIDLPREPAAEDPSSAAKERTVQKKIFEVKKWNAVSIWAWDVVADNCAICRNNIMDLCIECQAQARQLDDREPDCTVAKGVCNHAFHFHCITRWLNTRQVCPLDNSEWEFDSVGDRDRDR